MKNTTFICAIAICLSVAIAIISGCGGPNDDPFASTDSTQNADKTAADSNPAEPIATGLDSAEASDLRAQIKTPESSVGEPKSIEEPALPDVPALPEASPKADAPALPEEITLPKAKTPAEEEPALPEAPVASEAPALPETSPKADAPALPEEIILPKAKTPAVEEPALPEAPAASEIPALPEAPAISDAPALPEPPAASEALPTSEIPEANAPVEPVETTTPPLLPAPPAVELTPPALQDVTTPPEINENATLQQAAQALSEPAAAPAASSWMPSSGSVEQTPDQNDAAPSISEPAAPAEDDSHILPPPPKQLDSPNETTIQLEDVSPQSTAGSSSVNSTAKSAANTPKEIVKPPFDPIKENGPIFVGWKTPKVALIITGQQNGYLEPCGCAGLDRMKGGLSRRYSFIQGLREKGWPLIALDVGGMCNSFGKQAELKFHTTASSLRAMGYDAIALGKAELGFPAADILSEIVNADGTPGMFVSANVSVFERNAGMPQPYKIIEKGGLKFGITSVLCKSAQNFNQNSEILLSGTKAALDSVLPILKKESHIRILLSHGTVDEATKIARDYPDFQIIVTAGGNPEPPAKPVILPSGQYIITVGQKGMCSIVLGFFDNGVLKYQRVPHDSRFEQSDVIRQMMQSYQDQLKELWLEGLGIRPVPQTDPSRGANVGPKKCQTCHEHQYNVWKKSKHAHAFKSLEDAKPARDFDPECVCCHVVGWHRHLYFPYQKGYVKPGADDYLKNVSCEACHGPGESHIAAESSSNVENQKAQREKMRIDLKFAKEKMCGDCHDLDNSPNFNPDEYWELIKHNEPEDEQ